ncbi:MAG: glycosyltransferase family 2 protein [Solirubrobacterales bacterium]
MTVSVVIPTRNRPAALARCLAAVGAQDPRPAEVVVVDDGSRDRPAVAKAVAGMPGARLLRLPGRGPAAARNVGARAAVGKIVCFADDDCEPEPGWLGLVSEAAAEHGAAAGQTQAPDGAGPTVVASQAITNHLLEASLDRDGVLGFAPTSNLAVARPLLTRFPFDERFPDAAGEDRDWSARVAAAGSPPRYEPRAVVVHHQSLGTAAFLRQQFRYGRGAARFRRAHPARAPERPGFYGALVRHGFAHGTRAGALVLAAQAAVAAGVVTEAVRRR